MDVVLVRMIAVMLFMGISTVLIMDLFCGLSGFVMLPAGVGMAIWAADGKF